MLEYFKKSLIALDVYVNVLTGGLEDETISARVYRVSLSHPGFDWKQPGVMLAKALNALLDVIQPNHGKYAALDDLQRADIVVHDEDTALGLPPKPPT